MPSLQPIGVARTPFGPDDEIPREGGGPARVVLFEEFEQGLEGIERNSHLWIVGWFEGASRSVATRGRKAPADAPARGVFAMRSPSRPNPLGLTPARLLGRSGRVLELDRLDFRDGTPVVDIKPYSPGWDLIPAATSGHRYDPERYTRQELTQALWRDATNALGSVAETRPRVVSTIAALVELTFGHRADIRAPALRYELDSPDERVDVVLCATGASFGNERLSVAQLPSGTLLRATLVDGTRLSALDTAHGIAWTAG